MGFQFFQLNNILDVSLLDKMPITFNSGGLVVASQNSNIKYEKTANF